ncbi:MAG: helix-turn-helix transcriptional regulator [Firmicutes bacterium]|nr:helix-turn-helix transcriptional regulator [Bacillota bacterium]MCL5972203.1 helix-turn-helix transcriptional regulator [Bacillota bacterium]
MATMQRNTARLRAMMAERGWTEHELARAMDIGYPYLNRLLKGQRGLGVHALACLRLAGIAWEDVVELVPTSPTPDAPK